MDHTVKPNLVEPFYVFDVRDGELEPLIAKHRDVPLELPHEFKVEWLEPRE